MTVTNERLDEMILGLEGVTPGPWVSIHHSGPGSEIRQTDTDPTNKHHWPFRVAHTVAGQTANVDRANFDHIARCDPDTMREILTELRSLRTQAAGEAVAYITHYGNPILRQDFPDYWLADPTKFGLTPLFTHSKPVEVGVKHRWPDRSPPMMGDGRPAWQQMKELAEKAQDNTRFRDEMVSLFLWARYGWENRKPEVDDDGLSTLTDTAKGVEVTEAAAFLIDRLDDFENGSLGDGIEDACRDFDGHISPAIERLRAALTASLSEVG